MKTSTASPLLRVAVLSDLHMDERSWRARRLERALAKMERAERFADLLIVPGDVTDDGSEDSWRCVKRVFSKYRPAGQVLFAIGNHDTDGGETGQRNFIQYTNTVCGLDLDRPYYSRVVNGIPFLFLGSEGSALDAILSDAQIAWFEDAAATAGTERPIFVVCHQSFNGTHGLPYTWNRDHSATDPMEGGIGVKNDRIRTILSQYRNVFYISGHIHEGLCRGKTENGHTWSSVERGKDGIRRINAPCFMFPNHDGDPAPGKGYTIEVFEDKVLLQGTDFLHGVRDPHFAYSFDLS